MNRRILLLWLSFALGCFVSNAQDQKPLRVFIRAGVKTHGPGQHDHPKFLEEYPKILKARGVQAVGGMNFPTAAQLEATDVLVLYTQEGGTIVPEDRANLDKFLKRGGGIVVIHDAICGTDPQWFKTIVGGAWEHGHSKWYEGDVNLYFVDQEHPITRGISNFGFKDEIYWDLHMMPEARVLATSFHSVFNIVPQMWVYEKDNYRAFVCIPGHEWTSFELPHFRAILMRGIAWAGKRDVDSFVTKEELASLRYPEGGPTAPEKAAAKIVIDPEFDINLVASEPLIEKVISMDWDEKGRLWVAETPEYPNGRRINKNDEVINPKRELDPQAYQGEYEKRPAKDRISILTDMNGDGRMDKKTVFYEGLELVTSLVLYRDGVIVSQAPDIYWLRDTDGDGVADKKEVLFTGFGNSDTHAVISNLRWGSDGWIYATQGYSGARPKSADGSKQFGNFGSGVLRFKPDGSAIEMVSSKGGNTWGLDFNADNELFFTQANGTHLQHVVLPEWVLAKGRLDSTPSYKTLEDHRRVFPLLHYEKQPYVQIDNVGGFTAASGSAIYTGGAWPEKYNGVHFVSEPTVNLVHLDVLKPEGSSFVASKDREGEFIGSRDYWFRPIHQRVGPDGALYVIDFYNQAAVHNDTRGPKHGAGNAAVRPDRDHHFARIWRVQAKHAKQLEDPKLDRANVDSLVNGLKHPNGFYRTRANRLLSENGNAQAAPALIALAKNGNESYTRIQALWVLSNLGQITPEVLTAAFSDKDPAVRRNASIIAAAAKVDPAFARKKLIAQLQDADPRARLDALAALSEIAPDQEVAQAVVAAYPKLSDRWMESAAIAAASSAPITFIDACFSSDDTKALAPFVANVTTQAASKQNGDLAALLIKMIAMKPASGDDLKQVVLENLASGLNAQATPEWNASLKAAFEKLLGSKAEGVGAASLPLVARWDKNHELGPQVAPFIAKLKAKVSETGLSDTERVQLSTSLIGVRALDPEIVSTVCKVFGSEASAATQKKILEALGNVQDQAVGAALTANYLKLPNELREAAFAQIIKRSDWTLAFLDAIKGGQIPLNNVGPLGVHRLRTHSDKAVAEKANKIIDDLRGPEAKEKDALIAQFTPIVVQHGDAGNGHKIFTQNCSTCHAFKGEGKDIAPDLSGMGAHGPADLIVHILDPNRLVEPNFVAYSIETKDDQVIDGVIGRENQTSIFIRNALGDVEVKKNNIKSQRSTGLSLMPNGFEALGGEALRDLLTFICEGEARFRVLDISPAATVNSERGIYSTQESVQESLHFKKYGLVKVDEVPFEILSPQKSASGLNLIVLKGGDGYAKTLPQKVEIKTSVKAHKLHFLSGVGGWAWPWGGDAHKGIPAAKVTVHYDDNSTDEFLFKNGIEFADYVGEIEVPGSKLAPGLMRRGQIRTLSRPVKSSATIDRIIIESFNNEVAPTFVAITAEVGAPVPGGTTAPNAAAATETKPSEPAKPTDILIVGGGSSHNFDRWFNQEDVATLSAANVGRVDYTSDTASVASRLSGIKVLYLSNNQPFKNANDRAAIFHFPDSGRGMLLVHPALWFNWNADWPEYNRQLVSGGAHSHESLAEFDVTVDQPDHPLMAGVPKTFRVKDELYRFEKDASGPEITVLATGHSLSTGKSYPVVWITAHPKGRIVCVTLGHDGVTHQHVAYKTLLVNSVKWLSAKP
jgi:putative membrane-bound dehydrogenase-like protein